MFKISYHMFIQHVFPSHARNLFKGRGGLVVKVSASRPKDRGFEPRRGHDHVSL